MYHCLKVKLPNFDGGLLIILKMIFRTAIRSILFSIGLLIFLTGHAQTPSSGPQPAEHPRCNIEYMQAALIAKDSTWADRFRAQKASLQSNADYYKRYKAEAATGQRTSSTISPVPVIFHIAVDSAQFNAMGGVAGIVVRCDSQIAVLNRDFNHENADSTGIPTFWKDSLYGDPGIHFALARVDPNGDCSPGFELKIIPGNTLTDGGFQDTPLYNGHYTAAKTAGIGLAAWDNTKYYNVWCIQFTDNTGLLGVTVPLSFTIGESSTSDEGACILYSTLGCTAPDGTPPANTGGTAGWYYPFNLGRTLTHETGHMFEIWHPWGDDLGKCPWNQTGTSCTTGLGEDDGLYDTPPQSNHTYNAPTYTITGGTLPDCCQNYGSANTQPIGIACLSFMDYTNDNVMHLFTPDQAAAMASMVLVPPIADSAGATGRGSKIGENYNLSQNPNLLVPPCTPEGMAPSPTEINSDLNIYPNPTTGEIHIFINSKTETLNEIIVLDLLGQQIIKVAGNGNDYYTLNISGMSKGMYFIQCNFISGSITRKVLLQ